MNQKHLLRFIKSKLKKNPNVSLVDSQIAGSELIRLHRRSSFIEMARI